MTAKKNVKSHLKNAQPSGLLLGDLSSLMNPQTLNSPGLTGPQALAIALIKEDPNQPRKSDNPGFRPESIAELGSTIKERGVKSPISVRDDPENSGYYIINHGARRFRASQWAGADAIPAFVDNNYQDEDQVIENLHRNELTAREIADYIGRERAKGFQLQEIAKRLGKSRAYVSQHATLLDLPDVVADVFNSGSTKDLTVINELVTVYKKHPEELTRWLAEEKEISRGELKVFREFLQAKTQNQGGAADGAPQFADDDDASATGAGDTGLPVALKEKAKTDPTVFKKAIVQVSHAKRGGRLLTTRRPTEEGFAWLKYDDNGSEVEVSLNNVKLVAVREA